jgi:hypothetical protein
MPSFGSHRTQAFGAAARAALGVVLGITIFATKGSAGAPPAPPPGHVVLLELFTSQGCSSCPPADRLLSAIGAEDAGRVVPLAFHVDYWNHQGWTDPFSSRDWTLRQIAYERKLGLNQPYSPQAVVDGTTEMVGSEADKLRAAIRSASERPGATLALDVAPSPSKVEVAVQVDVPETLRDRKLDLYVVLFETGLSTAVGRGENGGQTLQNDYVVRAIDRVGRLPKGESASHHTASLKTSKDWNAARLGVAAFVQDAGSLAVLGAAATSCCNKPGA